MRSYTISVSERDAVAALTRASAPIDLVTLGGPIQPTQVRKLRGGWAGAEWVRVVADYQDGPSVGYTCLGDLEVDHEWLEDMVLEFTPEGPSESAGHPFLVIETVVTQAAALVDQLLRELESPQVQAAAQAARSGCLGEGELSAQLRRWHNEASRLKLRLLDTQLASSTALAAAAINREARRAFHLGVARVDAEEFDASDYERPTSAIARAPGLGEKFDMREIVSKSAALACPSCGVEAVVCLTPSQLAEQPDATTHVCHPGFGGCNSGFSAVRP